ncbi:hypothetical protein [Campylobacter troglodytis]|uniref:hypothetical protein n=1 Tax=Campylobacter troglodytis TaxID=654363 RepID=UPI00115B40AA|nr:hypothetical protein [Campylobacter troglodytis]
MLVSIKSAMSLNACFDKDCLVLECFVGQKLPSHLVFVLRKIAVLFHFKRIKFKANNLNLNP